MHAADLADLLESLPQDERLALWRLVGNSKRGQTLVEVAEPVWDSLIEEMSDKDLLKAIKGLDVDEQAYLAQYLPRNLMGRLLTSLEPEQRAQVREMSHYGKDTVGWMMDFELVTVRPDVTLGAVHRLLRMRKTIPDATDKLFVTDRKTPCLVNYHSLRCYSTIQRRQCAKSWTTIPPAFNQKIKPMKRPALSNVMI